MKVDEDVRKAILDFVDSIVPDGGLAVWLTGSRVRGDARPDSDWDVVAFFRDYPIDDLPLFGSNQTTDFRISGGVVELILAHPSHWDDPRPYMAELRKLGIRLR